MQMLHWKQWHTLHGSNMICEKILCKIFPETMYPLFLVIYCHTLPCTPGYTWIHPDTHGYTQIHPDTSFIHPYTPGYTCIHTDTPAYMLHTQNQCFMYYNSNCITCIWLTNWFAFVFVCTYVKVILSNWMGERSELGRRRR